MCAACVVHAVEIAPSDIHDNPAYCPTAACGRRLWNGCNKLRILKIICENAGAMPVDYPDFDFSKCKPTEL